MDLKVSSCGLLSYIINHVIIGIEDKHEKLNLRPSTLLLRK